MQSALVVQLVGQPVGLQTYLPQSCVPTCVRQPPEPSQVFPVMNVFTGTHCAVMSHEVEDCHCSQAQVAVHLPSSPQVAGADATQMPRGSATPVFARPQIPSPFATCFFASTHAWH